MKRKQAAGENSNGFTNEQSPQGGALSRDLLVQKSMFPLFPMGGMGEGWGERGYKWLVHKISVNNFSSILGKYH